MDNVRVQMDLYHCQIMEGDLTVKIKHYLPTGLVSHLQIAGVPERFEPNIGEINYAYLFTLLEAMDYQGYIGCEYRPSRGKAVNSTTEGLDWLRSLPRS
jgi:hydroxypyruvate isomerase